MDQSIIHFLELVGVLFGSLVALVKIWPQFRQVAVILQIAFFLTQMFNTYLKNNPEKRKQLQTFISQVLDHYFKTHPQGQEIARTSNVDEKIQQALFEEPKVKKDLNVEFHRLFGVKVDMQ